VQAGPVFGEDVGDGVGVEVGAGVGDDVVVVYAVVLCDPPAPVHVRVKVVFAPPGVLDSEPLVALLPTQPPDAVQDVALVDDQLNVVDCPCANDDGAAVKVTAGTLPEDDCVVALA